MKATLGRRLCQVAAFAVLAACSVHRDDFIAAWIDADCERAARCGEYVSKDACLEHGHMFRVADEELTAIMQAIASPRVTYVASEGEACIERRRNASCDRTAADWRTVAGSCAYAFRGEVPNGGDCYIDAECRDGECPVRVCTQGFCCVSTCVDVRPPARLGEACITRRCVEGTFCDSAGICADLVGAGGECAAQDQCGYGLNCDNGVCGNAPGRGESCLQSWCENWFGDRCSPTSGTCEPLAAAGELCEWSSDCQLPLLCASRTCVEPPGAGEACVDGTWCRVGTRCVGGICVEQRREGETCQDGFDCVTGYCDGVCTTPPTCDELRAN